VERFGKGHVCLRFPNNGQRLTLVHLLAKRKMCCNAVPAASDATIVC
jgi:hypothetical protein